MPWNDIKTLRGRLGLSRAELSRFLGVSEATVVRWESDAAASEPKGLQALLLSALGDASLRAPPEQVARVVRRSALDHRNALRTLLAAAAGE